MEVVLFNAPNTTPKSELNKKTEDFKSRWAYAFKSSRFQDMCGFCFLDFWISRLVFDVLANGLWMCTFQNLLGLCFLMCIAGKPIDLEIWKSRNLETCDIGKSSKHWPRKSMNLGIRKSEDRTRELGTQSWESGMQNPEIQRVQLVLSCMLILTILASFQFDWCTTILTHSNTKIKSSHKN